MHVCMFSTNLSLPRNICLVRFSNSEEALMPSTTGCKHTVVASEVHPRPWHQCNELRQKIQRLVHDVGSAVAPGRLDAGRAPCQHRLATGVVPIVPRERRSGTFPRETRSASKCHKVNYRECKT
jgi:hypothetical protein